jgi:hypothetical protein
MIINVTQHDATPDQIAAGVVELLPQYKEAVRGALTFSELPNHQNKLLHSRAAQIAQLVLNQFLMHHVPKGERLAMIGGAPFFMSHLEMALFEASICPVYAFSQRVSEETNQADGSVKKTQVFKHEGFVFGRDWRCNFFSEASDILCKARDR